MKNGKGIQLHPLMWLVLGLVVASVIIFVIALWLPPQGEVHPSVLKGLAIITADIALVIFAHAIASGKTATFRHGSMTATIGDDDDEQADN